MLHRYQRAFGAFCVAACLVGTAGAAAASPPNLIRAIINPTTNPSIRPTILPTRFVTPTPLPTIHPCCILPTLNPNATRTPHA